MQPQGTLIPAPNQEERFRRASKALGELRELLPKSEYDAIEAQTASALCRVGIAEVVRQGIAEVVR